MDTILQLFRSEDLRPQEVARLTGWPQEVVEMFRRSPLRHAERSEEEEVRGE